MSAVKVSRPIDARLPITPLAALSIAAALLIVSLVIAFSNERAARAEAVQQAHVQAEILAGSVAAPLAFDDQRSTQEYVNALRANPAVEAAGAYDQRGRLAAAFGRAGPAPPRIRQGAPSFDRGSVTVTAPVRQGTTILGSVVLRVSTESFARRVSRYFAIGAVVVMASMLVAMLGISNARLREAHHKLQVEIGEREKAEAALRQAQKMEAMGQLTGGVAHDFNNLLMVASSGLDLMERTTDPVRRDRLKQGIRQAIERGANLTQQLLAFARKAPLKAEVVDLAVRLQGMQDVLDRSLREDVAVRIEADDDLWPVELDPGQFEVAVLNIAINARDAMPKGGTITIRLCNVPGGSDARDMVRISIADTGAGMAPELLNRVFEPFFTTKGVGDGTGLGLSQVYGFARASGGEVKMESEPGAGATVTLLLPRSNKLPPRPAESPAQDAPSAGHERRVLVVEDDERVAELVGEMMSELGYKAVCAPTADAALKTLEREAPFDLVFSDMVMPGEMSGLDLARLIVAGHPELPVVLTTGYSASAAAAAAEGLRLLVKPYRIDALAAEMEAALKEHRPR